MATNKGSAIERVCEFIRNERAKDVSTDVSTPPGVSTDVSTNVSNSDETMLTETTPDPDYLYDIMLQSNIWRQQDEDDDEESELDFYEKWCDF